ncbi:hypothetical protein NC651_036580 [Populus alba x Populus x berolinensis]|nr:hypothetical protein NC651_036580 [Populus alba x Populus x berolinensis]
MHFLVVMCTDHVKEKRELIQAILQDRSLSDLPKITQPTLTIWGEQDQIFPQIEKVNLKSSVDFGF